MENFSMVSSHSVKELAEDTIFKVSREAGEASKKFGNLAITNASIGALMDDSGKLCVIPSVMDTLRGLKNEDFAAYAPIAGLPDFLETVKTAALRNAEVEGYFRSVATPGGSGAIRHTIWNYSEMGDTVLTADWYWGPYKTITEENGRKLTTFNLFDENMNFNIKSFEERVHKLLLDQRRLVILLNSPSNNPTGYNISDEEWEKIIHVLKEEAKDETVKVVVFVDIAYIDYSSKNSDGREFMKNFSNLPKNILTIFGFSMSKGYTLYGMRCGAMLCLSSDEKIAIEFRNANEYSNRGVWSNGTRSAMTVLSKIFADGTLLNKVDSERNDLKKMLFGRADAFVEEAQRVGLKICPYKSGFFISIPCEDAKVITQRLQRENVFAVPMSKGIRFAVCAVPEDKCRIVPAKIKSVL